MNSYESYLECYGIKLENIYWIRNVPVFACIATSREDADQFIAEHRRELNDPKIVSIEAGKPIPAYQAAQFPF